ncbi:MAG: hypothetical protein WDN49_15580 [Acetobacteraceae bacterium]
MNTGASAALAPSSAATGPRARAEGRAAPARRALGRLLAGIAGLAVLLGLWWAGTDLLAAPGSLGRQFSPVSTAASLVDLLLHSDLPLHVAVSLRRVLVGLLGALAIGVPLGLAVGSFSVLEDLAAVLDAGRGDAVRHRG